jgi:hypothetical protein
MYLTLKSQYGYTDDNIVVVYKDSIAENAQMIVDHPADYQGLTNAINDLKSRMGSNPLASLFVFTTNHGGGYNKLTNVVIGGSFDTAPNVDETPTETAETSAVSLAIDETIFLYSPDLYVIDEDWAAKINSVVGPSRLLITVNEPCFSGGLLKDLKGPNRINISASSEGEYSYSLDDGTYDEFSYYFTAALHKKYPRQLNNALRYSPDLNGINGVSVYEAYLYARDLDRSPARCLLDDNADGAGTHIPPATGALDGVLAKNTRL